MVRILDNTIVQSLLCALFIGVAVLCIFTPDVFFIKKIDKFAVQIMISFLMLGMVFLVLDKKRLMFASLFACGILSFHLKSISDQGIRFPSVNTNPQISVANIDLSLSNDLTETMMTIWAADVDVISFQEYTPDWDQYLREELCERYPFSNTLTRIDPYGMAIYSKLPLREIDTVWFEGRSRVPSLRATVSLSDDTEIHLLSTHSMPAVNSTAYEQIRGHYNSLCNYLEDLAGPVITLGDFSLPSWSEEIREFKAASRLNDSRRDVVPAAFSRPVFMFNIPIDYIFYSRDFECTSFKVIDSKSKSHVGILGKYQLIKITEADKEGRSGVPQF